jgi:hypothetical protein
MTDGTQHAAPIIAASAIEGLIVTLPDGRPARLAVIDESGGVITSDAGITRQAFDASCRAYRNFLQGLGHIRVVSDSAGTTDSDCTAPSDHREHA